MLKKGEYYELVPGLDFAAAKPLLEKALLSNDKIMRDAKGVSLTKLREEVIDSFDEIPGGERKESLTQKLLATLGIEPAVEDQAVFTLDEVLDFLARTRIGEDGWTPRMKLEKLIQGYETVLSPETEYVLRELQERNILARVHIKPKVTIGCKQAADVRGIAPFQEMKSLLFSIETPQGQQIVAFHMRGDEALDPENAVKLARKHYGADAKLVSAGTDLHLAEYLGLTAGRVSPLSIKWAAEQKGIEIKQFFSETIDQQFHDFPQEMFTNAASNFKGISFKWDSFRDGYRDEPGFVFGSKFVGRTADRDLYLPKSYVVIADDTKKFGETVAAALRAVLKNLWGERKLVTPVNTSLHSRIEPLFHSGPTGYYDIENDQKVVRQVDQSVNSSDLFLVGHNASLARPSILTSQARRGLDANRFIYVTDVAVESIKANGQEDVQVITSSNFVRRWDESAYADLGGREVAIHSQRIDDEIKFVDGFGGDSLNQRAGQFVQWFVGEVQSGGIQVHSQYLLVGSAELEKLLTQSDGKAARELEAKLEVQLIFPLKLTAERATQMLYPKLYEEKEKARVQEAGKQAEGIERQ